MEKGLFFFMLSLTTSVFLLTCSKVRAKHYIIYPAPLEESLSQLYKVSVEGKDIPVYRVKVASRVEEERWKAMDDKKNSAEYYEEAAFAYFDMNDEVNITVTMDEEIRSVKILPHSAGIITNTEGKFVSFKIKSPMNLTIEINDEWVRSLQLFANPFEEDVPDQSDPDVIYFGPGIHEVSNLVIGDNKIVYVAGGAIVRAIIDPNEPFGTSSVTGLKNYSPSFALQGQNITFRGRGIVDGSLCSTHSRYMILVDGSDINLEGFILRDAPQWTIPVRRSDRVHIDNLKLLGYRANSDGIDICNSRDVLIENCFIRTLDDCVVIKSFKGEGKTKNIITRKCVLWNEVAHALSIGAEIREDVDNVIFEDCDVIRDKGREWSLKIFHSDAGRVSNVRFENIRIEESQRFISLWLGKGFYSRDNERGYIQGVEFKNISAAGNLLNIELLGYNKEHLIEDVLFKNVKINNKGITIKDIQTNSFVKNITVSPLL